MWSFSFFFFFLVLENGLCIQRSYVIYSLRASSPIWASEVSLAGTRERGAPRSFAARSCALARLASFAQIAELARRICHIKQDGLVNFLFCFWFSYASTRRRFRIKSVACYQSLGPVHDRSIFQQYTRFVPQTIVFCFFKITFGNIQSSQRHL